jgi:hypothetical protein
MNLVKVSVNHFKEGLHQLKQQSGKEEEQLVLMVQNTKLNLRSLWTQKMRRRKNSKRGFLNGVKVICVNCSIPLAVDYLFSVFADGGETKSSKKDKIRYTYRTTEEVVEEISKGGVHKMAREYRYGI